MMTSPTYHSSSMHRGIPEVDNRRRYAALLFTIAVIAVGSIGLLFGAVRGNATIGSLTDASNAATTNLDNAYYHCLDAQTRSLVAPGEPVLISLQGNVADVLRAAGKLADKCPSWITSPRDSAHRKARTGKLSRVGHRGNFLKPPPWARRADRHRCVGTRQRSFAPARAVMTTGNVAASLLLLALAGLLPSVCLIGRRWTVVPLSVLGGSLISALAATCYVGVGGPLMVWYFVIAGVAALASVPRLISSVAIWRTRTAQGKRRRDPHDRNIRAFGVAALLVSGIWCLRGLRSPMIGLDARLFWILRAGWWLMPHAEGVANMQRLGAETHAGYPPLISSTVAVAWWASGDHSERMATILIAIVNLSAALVAVWLLIDFGSHLRRTIAVRSPGRAPHPLNQRMLVLSDAPLFAGLAIGILLLLCFFGVTEPFTTNGYADPLWSVAAVGAVGYVLLLPTTGYSLGTAAILLGVAGETKTEGAAIAVGIILLLSAGTCSIRGERWFKPGHASPLSPFPPFSC